MSADATVRARYRAPAAVGLLLVTAVLTAACSGTPTLQTAAGPSAAATASAGSSGPESAKGEAVEHDISAIVNLDSGSQGSQLGAECAVLKNDASLAVGYPLGASGLSLSQWNALMDDLVTQAGTCVTGIANGDQPTADQAQLNIIGDGNQVEGSG